MKKIKVTGDERILAQLKKNNRIFFNNASFHKDEKYTIDEHNRILTVKTDHGNVRYSYDEGYILEYIGIY